MRQHFLWGRKNQLPYRWHLPHCNLSIDWVNQGLIMSLWNRIVTSPKPNIFSNRPNKKPETFPFKLHPALIQDQVQKTDPSSSWNEITWLCYRLTCTNLRLKRLQWDFLFTRLNGDSLFVRPFDQNYMVSWVSCERFSGTRELRTWHKRYVYPQLRHVSNLRSNIASQNMLKHKVYVM